GQGTGGLSAKATAVARSETSPARPTETTNLSDDRRRRSCMERLLPCPLGTSRRAQATPSSSQNQLFLISPATQDASQHSTLRYTRPNAEGEGADEATPRRHDGGSPPPCGTPSGRPDPASA